MSVLLNPTLLMNLLWLLDNSKEQMEEKSVPKLSEAVLFVIMREKMLQVILLILAVLKKLIN